MAGPVKRIAFVIALVLGVALPATSAAAQQPPWYWYNSSASTTGGCWESVASPSAGAQDINNCDTISSGYVPTYGGLNTYLHNGALWDVTSKAARSGDYCNSYNDQVNGDPFTGDVDQDPYYYGDPSTTDTYHGSYCYADAATWGTNDNEISGGPIYNPGVQHFASIQGIIAKPWSFGGSPELFVNSKFGVMTNSSTHAWGYLCADLKDPSSGEALEICADVWDWGNKNAPNNVGGCISASTGAKYGSPALGMVEDYLAKPGTQEIYTTTRPGSSYTQTNAKTLTPVALFSMDITTANLKQAASDADRVCGLSLSTTNLAGYQLMGVEQGVELGSSTGDVNGVEQDLQFATLYN
jgi:hypothetical protein